MRRVVALVLVLVLVVSVIGAAVWLLRGSGSTEAQEPPRVPKRPVVATQPDPEATTPPDPALARFYEQQVDWASCRSRYQCARIEVPLDYADPGGETIEIQLLKRPADVPEQRIGALLVNPGGPGAPGTMMAEQAGYVLSRDLRASFDVVGFDPRGTGESSPVDCVSDALLDEFRSSDPTPETPAEVAQLDAQTRAFLAGCAKNSGRLAGHVSTVEAARDMDVIRAALGETGLNYLGASYGTKLGATYADLFPDRAAFLVLDSAVDLTLGPRKAALQQARGFETALRAYVENCLESSGCFLGETVEEGLTRIKEFLAEVEETPLEVSAGREVRIGDAFYGLITPLYQRDYWVLLSTALRTGFNGDGTTLRMLADLYASRGPDGYENNSAEAIVAINCLDEPASMPPERIPEQLPAFLEASPTLGEAFAWGLTGCPGMEVESSEETPDYRAEGADPILVLGTTRDPATPIEGAESMAELLSSGVLIRRDGDGHGTYFQGNACVDAAVEDFLLDGVAPAGPLDC